MSTRFLCFSFLLRVHSPNSVARRLPGCIATCDLCRYNNERDKHFGDHSIVGVRKLSTKIPAVVLMMYHPDVDSISECESELQAHLDFHVVHQHHGLHDRELLLELRLTLRQRSAGLHLGACLACDVFSAFQSCIRIFSHPHIFDVQI